MRLKGGAVRLSASDLMRFTGCAHATHLDLEHLHGRGPEPAEDSADADLLQRHGDAHEAQHLARLKGRGEVAEIDKEQPFHQAVETTVVALRSGEPVVFQGALEGGAWGGWSDFLERVEEPSDLGTFSYEVADTKLKRKPAPGHVLQLVLYSDLLARVQGRAPERAHVELGDGSRFSFRLAEYAAYARQARERLEAFVARPWATRPVPTAACPLCRWRDHCADRWKAEDSLFEVAGITRSQVAKLEAAGVATLAALAEREERVPKLAPPTLDRLRLQARLQHARKSGPPRHALREALPGKGFDLLPRPDPGDLFYDIEGDPFYAEGGVDGLEYLHGVWDGAELHRPLGARPRGGAGGADPPPRPLRRAADVVPAGAHLPLRRLRDHGASAALHPVRRGRGSARPLAARAAVLRPLCGGARRRRRLRAVLLDQGHGGLLRHRAHRRGQDRGRLGRRLRGMAGDSRSGDPGRDRGVQPDRLRVDRGAARLACQRAVRPPLAGPRAAAGRAVRCRRGRSGDTAAAPHRRRPAGGARPAPLRPRPVPQAGGETRGMGRIRRGGTRLRRPLRGHGLPRRPRRDGTAGAREEVDQADLPVPAAGDEAEDRQGGLHPPRGEDREGGDPRPGPPGAERHDQARANGR